MKRLLAVFMAMCLTMGNVCLDVSAADPSETVTDNSVTVSETNAGDARDLTDEVDSAEEIEVNISEPVEESAAAVAAAEDETSDTSVSTVSDDILYSGTDGDLEWSISSDGVLTISGVGDYVDRAWKDYTDYITSAVVNVSGITDTSYMFRGCSSLVSLDLDSLDTSKVTSMNSMFSGCKSLTSLNLSYFKTSNVTGMSNMFLECSSLTTLDLSSFDTTNVIGMAYMFKGCSNLVYLDVSGFVTSNVTTTKCMFYDCSSLKELDVSNFDTSKVKDTNLMFGGCSSLASLDVSNFDTAKAEDISGMFSGCSGLTSLDVSGFNTTNAQWMDGMFSGCSGLTSLDVSSFDTSNVNETMNYMFDGCSGLTDLDLSGFDTSNVTGMVYMFRNCSNLISLDVSNFDTSNVTSMKGMFEGCSSLTTLDITGFDTTNVGSVEGMFRSCESLTYLDLSNFDTSNTTDVAARTEIFADCGSLSVVKIGSGMKKFGNYVFQNCTSLNQIYFMGDAPEIVGSYIFRTVTATAYYPADNETWTEDKLSDYGGTITWIGYNSDEDPTVAIVASGTCGTDLTWILNENGVLTISGTGDIEGYSNGGAPWYSYRNDIVSVVIKDGVTGIGIFNFFELVNLISVSIPDSVLSIGYGAFEYCSNLETIVIPDSVTSIGDSAFYGNNSLTHISLSANITTIGTHAFSYCSSLTDILVDEANTIYCSIDGVLFDKAVTTILAYPGGKEGSYVIPDGITCIADEAFSYCTELTEIIIPDSVHSIGDGAFCYCTKLIEIIIPDSVSSIGASAFSFCTALTKIEIPVGVTTIERNTFWGCYCLSEITIPDTVSSIGIYAFYLCRSLKSITIPGTVITISDKAFEYCRNLDEIYFEGNAPEFGSNVFYEDTLTAYYPADNETWTDDVMQNYGGNVTWVAVGEETSPVTIITQPQSVTVEKSGDTATLTVEAEGDGLNYCWYYKNPGNSVFKEAGYYTESVSVVMLPSRDGREMYCVITDEYGNTVTTDIVTLSIKAVAITIITQPQSVVVENEGDTATVTVVAEGESLSYSWYYKNPGNRTFSESKIYTASTTVAVTAARNGRQMYCVITDADGNSVTTETVTLSIQEKQESTITIVTQPESVVVENEGDTATVTVVAEGDGLSYSWYYKNPGNSTFSESKIYTASTTVAVTAARNGRQMYCVITDVNGNSVTTDTVTLSIKEEQESTITIVAQPQSVTVANAGDVATVSVEAEGDGLTYSWYYKNPGNSDFKESKIYTSSTTVAVTEARNGRQMYCVITDVNGNSVTTDVVTLSIQEEQESTITIITQPESVVVENEGDTATLTVVAEGEGLSYSWYYKNPGNRTFSESKIYTASTTVAVTAARNGRQMYCVITDANGNSVTTDTVTLSIQESQETSTAELENVSIESITNEAVPTNEAGEAESISAAESAESSEEESELTVDDSEADPMSEEEIEESVGENITASETYNAEVTSVGN